MAKYPACNENLNYMTKSIEV